MSNDIAFELNNLKREYKEFADKNDLDRLLTKNLDLTRCKRVLEGVTEMMKVTDWGKIDKSFVNKANVSEASLHL